LEVFKLAKNWKKYMNYNSYLGYIAMKEAISKLNSSRCIRRVDKNIRP
jgi:hypothetical protein